jgi:hypothetical protein
MFNQDIKNINNMDTTITKIVCVIKAAICWPNEEENKD